MKNSQQLTAKIKNIANEKNVKPEIILRNYMLERFLERISMSKYNNNFVLKGGLLIASVIGIEARSTMDLDTSIKRLDLSEDDIHSVIAEIMQLDAHDNVIFSFSKIEEIREEGDYPGFRVSLTAKLDATVQRLKIDITTGDTIIPTEILYSFPTLFSEKPLHILAYPIETVLAEKFETILARSVLNTRMRDFYDVYILQKLVNFSLDDFKISLKNTLENRGTTNSFLQKDDIITTIECDKGLITLWDRYASKYPYANDLDWNTIMQAIHLLNTNLGEETK